MASKARGLGKGLGALMGDAALSGNEGNSLLLPISQVEPGLNQPRKFFDEDALHDLADSIREHGIIQPLTVRRLASGYYQIIAGERRWRAARLAGLTDVPAVIIEADDKKVMELGLIENLQREDLNPMEEAEGYEVLMRDYGMTQEDVARRMGKSRPAVANTLRLLALPDELMAMLEEGVLSAGHARAILPLPSPEAQIACAKKVMEGELSVRQTEALVKALSKPEKPMKPTPDDKNDIRLYLEELEKELGGTLGRKVRINHKGKKGRIELEYYNDDDLELLLAALKCMGGGSGNG